MAQHQEEPEIISDITMPAPKKRRTQAERTAASDKAMFRAAIKLIARDGPSKMTLAKVGKEAGFSGGLVSYRFGSKSKLLQATLERILELWHDRVLHPAHADEPGVENIKLLAQLYLEAVEAKSDLMAAQYRLMNESYSSHRELQSAFRDYDNRVRTSIVNNLKPLQKGGEIDKNLDLESFAVLFMGTVRGIAVQYFIDDKSVDIQKAKKMVDAMLDRLLMPG
jgi:AcrR family transcriptional regulator